MYQNRILISSKDRDSGTFNEFHVPFTKSFRKIKSIEICDIDIPVTGDVFNSSNNIIYFNEGGGTLTATLTQGCYDEAKLCTEIKTQMEVAGALTYTVVVENTPVITKALVITATGAFTIEAEGTANKRLGFTETDHVSVLNIVRSDYPVNLAAPRFLLISISNLGLMPIVKTGIHSIPYHIVAYNYGDSYAISHNAQDNFYKFVLPTSFTSVSDIKVNITDENYNYILKSDWSMVIIINTCELC